MKSSALTLGLGILAATGSVMVAASAEAATLLFSNGPSISGDKFEFEFLPPTDGNFLSTLFVTQTTKTSVVQTLFTEPDSNNGSVTPNGVVVSGSWAATNGSYILGWGIKTDPLATLSGTEPTVYSNDTSPFKFKLVSGDPSWYTYAIEDIKNGGDNDFNDGKFRVRAVVPVPAIVPGIALAGAFFGSKVLKRKKNDASKASA